jgi:hypothetical protein
VRPLPIAEPKREDKNARRKRTARTGKQH